MSDFSQPVKKDDTPPRTSAIDELHLAAEGHAHTHADGLPGATGAGRPFGGGVGSGGAAGGGGGVGGIGANGGVGRAGRGWVLAAAVALASGLLHMLAFPPFNAGEAAYVFALPLLLYVFGRPRCKPFCVSVFAAFWLSWTGIIFWLRYIEPPWGLLGALALGAVLAVFPLLWFVTARALLPRLDGRPFLSRLLLLFGLAGLWVVLEWVRSWLFTGFPWAPLSVSQWKLPVMLQVAAWTGHYGVSFILVYWNLALAQYIRSWLLRSKTPAMEALDAHREAMRRKHGTADAVDVDSDAGAVDATSVSSDAAGNAASGAGKCGVGECDCGVRGADSPEADDFGADRLDEGQLGADRRGAGVVRSGRDLPAADAPPPLLFGSGTAGRYRIRLCPEFYVGLMFLMGSILLYQQTWRELRERVPMFNAAVVQPWIAASVKWEQEQARKTLEILQTLTLEAAQLDPRPDVIVWPETAPPLSLLNDKSDWMQRWTEGLVRQADATLLTGALVRTGGQLYNGIFALTPQGGLNTDFYAKRRLVPFGEYRPLRSLLPFIDKVVPLETDISRGAGPVLIETVIAGHHWKIGSLICYEDIFSGLGRAVATAEADFLLVVTNDAWYGEAAGAYQHAAHSVLRAVEARRPLLRCGNHGWSGWIDEAGVIRANLADANGNIYQRGTISFPMHRAAHWIGRESFYVRHGDWFVALCGGLTLLALLAGRGNAHNRSRSHGQKD